MSLHQRFVTIAGVGVMAIAGFSATASAQYHGHGHGGGHVAVGVGYYYSPYFYDPFWYGPWYPYAYPPYPGPYLAPDSSIRLEVKPSQAEVYVDGYYAGIVDDYDGTFQRLHVAPGQHEIELYLDGYRPVKQQLHLTADKTVKLKYAMEKLGAGEQAEPRPQPPNPPPSYQQGPPPMQPPPQVQPPPEAYPPPQAPGTRRVPPPPEGNAPRGGQQSAYGSLAVRVQPNDAEISIDGEPWRAPAGQERLIVEVAEGSHTVEIRKSGYRTYVTQIEVRRGGTTPLNVSLRSEP